MIASPSLLNLLANDRVLCVTNEGLQSRHDLTLPHVAAPGAAEEEGNDLPRFIQGWVSQELDTDASNLAPREAECHSMRTDNSEPCGTNGVAYLDHAHTWSFILYERTQSECVVIFVFNLWMIVVVRTELAGRGLSKCRYNKIGAKQESEFRGLIKVL